MDQVLVFSAAVNAAAPHALTPVLIGAGEGTLTSLTEGFQPYPTYPYYLDDFWVYDLTSGLWREISPASSARPSARADHVMITNGEILFLFGGYSTNYYYGDFWQYNRSKLALALYIGPIDSSAPPHRKAHHVLACTSALNTWLEQKHFPHARYPPNCTDDLEFRKNKDTGLYS